MIDHDEAGERTRLARRALGLTVAEAAACAGLSQTTVRRYERTWPAGSSVRTVAGRAKGYYLEMGWLAARR